MLRQERDIFQGIKHPSQNDGNLLQASEPTRKVDGVGVEGLKDIKKQN